MQLDSEALGPMLTRVLIYAYILFYIPVCIEAERKAKSEIHTIKYHTWNPIWESDKTQENTTYTRAKVGVSNFQQVIIYTLTGFVRAVKALTRLRVYTGLSEPSLLACAISTKGSRTAPLFDVYELAV